MSLVALHFLVKVRNQCDIDPAFLQATYGGFGVSDFSYPKIGRIFCVQHGTGRVLRYRIGLN